MRLLSTRRVTNMAGCGKCIAKWHCAGACLAKAAHDGDLFDATKLDNCQIARELTEHFVRSLMQGDGLRIPSITPRPVAAHGRKGGGRDA